MPKLSRRKYLIRELARGGFENDYALDQLSRDMVVEGFLKFARARSASLPARPVIGALTPSGWFRAGSLLLRVAFERAGCDYVFGGPEHLVPPVKTPRSFVHIYAQLRGSFSIDGGPPLAGPRRTLARQHSARGAGPA